MLLINCPWCGPRDEHEFRCGGQSHIQRPEPAEQISDETWGDYLYGRENPRGAHAERWVHQFGCGRWFNMLRSTVTHEILAVYEMGQPKPGVGIAKGEKA